MSAANLIRSCLVVTVLWAMACGSADAQTAAGEPQPQLTLSARLLSQRYCAQGSGMMTLHMRLHLRYTNAGAQKLILYRGEDLFYQARIRSVMPEAGKQRPYEIAILNARYLEVENEPVEQPAPGRLFVILQPGASYETETTLGIGLAGDASARARHAIMEGDHTLQIIVSTWYRSRSLADKLRQQWQRRGLLWSMPVASNEITFAASRPQSPPACR